MAKNAPLLDLQNLHISVEEKEIVRGLSLTIHPGEIHAIMGPNGSGKSTLVGALMGSPKYTITQGTASFNGQSLLKTDAAERARKGLFLAFQYPKEIAGVSLRSFLFAAYKAQHQARHPDQKSLTILQFKKHLEAAMQSLHMDSAFMERSLNQGFSGGEKKKAEVLQMTILQPLLALLDETDSGLDIDALKIVASGVNALREKDKTFSALVVTHYARILDLLKPDHVHVMVKGKIVESGGRELVETLEKEGYAKYGVTEMKISH